MRTCLHDPSHTETQVIPALSAQPAQPDPQPNPQPTNDGGAYSSLTQVFRDIIQIVIDFLQSFFGI